MQGGVEGHGSAKLQKGLNSRTSSMLYGGRGLVSVRFRRKYNATNSFVTRLCYLRLPAAGRRREGRELKLTYVLEGKKINFIILHHVCIYI